MKGKYRVTVYDTDMSVSTEPGLFTLAGGIVRAKELGKDIPSGSYIQLGKAGCLDTYLYRVSRGIPILVHRYIKGKYEAPVRSGSKVYYLPEESRILDLLRQVE